MKRSKSSRAVFEAVCDKYGIGIYRYANVGNHFHAVLRVYKRFLWKAFICELTSRLAALAGVSGGRFWAGRPFTRVIWGWGRNFKRVLSYVDLNELEAAGVITRAEVRAFSSA